MSVIWEEIFDASHKILDAIKQIIVSITEED